MPERTYSRIARRLAILFVLLSCQFTMQSFWQPQPAFGSEVKRAERPQQRAITYEYLNDKIFKIVAVRNLQKDTWLNDLEIELKNVSGKPIYLMQFLFNLPEIPPPPPATSTTILSSYGNKELMNNDKLAEETDVPIKPGETFVYKVPKDNIEYLRRYVSESDIISVTHVVFSFYLINFGDGTGFFLGQPAPDRVRKPNLEGSSLFFWTRTNHLDCRASREKISSA